MEFDQLATETTCWTWEKLQNAVYTASYAAGILKKVSTCSSKAIKKAAWYDEECRILKKTISAKQRLLRSIHQQNNRKLELSNLTTMRKNYFDLKRSKKKMYRNSIIEEVLNP